MGLRENRSVLLIKKITLDRCFKFKIAKVNSGVNLPMSKYVKAVKDIKILQTSLLSENRKSRK